MKIRSMVLCSMALGACLGTDFVGAADKHPVGNLDGRVWQIEYHKSDPRNGNYAVRLKIPPFDNPGSSGIVNLPESAGVKLYLSKRVDDTTPANRKYVDWTTTKLSGAVQAATIKTGPGTSPPKHFQKKHLSLNLTGTSSDGNIVAVYGGFHPGTKNKAGSANFRKDYRLVLNIVEKAPSVEIIEALKNFQSLLIEDQNLKGDEKESEAYKSRNEAFRALVKLLASGDCCELMDPGDAALEETLSDPLMMDPTIFTYGPEQP